MPLYEVILPLKLSWVPVYSSGSEVSAGTRVGVSCSGRKYVGVVWRRAADGPRPYRVLPLRILEDPLPPVSGKELRFWEFLSSYYLCTIGEIYKLAYPALKTNSEKTAAALACRRRTSRLKMVSAMEERVSRLEKLLSSREKQLSRRYSSTDPRKSEELTLRMESSREDIRSRLEAARASLESLRKMAADMEYIPSERHPRVVPAPGKPVLLQSSRRVSVYADAVSRVLEDGAQALVLVPELSFLDNLREVLEERFQDRLLLCTSQQSMASRRKVSDILRKGGPAVVLGTKPAVFLPYSSLSLIIIDEEQDICYKQTEPSPRYNARDAAVALGLIHASSVILGSSAPSLETLLNCRTGKYALFPDAPKDISGHGVVEVVDIGVERRKNGMVGCFSRFLVRSVASTPGDVVFVRGWEKKDELERLCTELFPQRKVSVLTLTDLKKKSVPPGTTLLAVLQADALVDADDFRADERALQLRSFLSSLSPHVIIQTAVADRFGPSRSVEDLLAERAHFSLPPYTRMVDVIVMDGDPSVIRSLSRSFPSGMTGPDRVRICLERNGELSESKRRLRETVDSLINSSSHAVKVLIDVDPL